MRNFFLGLAVFTAFAALSFCFVIRDAPTESISLPSTSSRAPSSFDDVRRAIEKVDHEIGNTKIFNPATASTYIHTFANQAYAMTSADFIPQGEAETKMFMNTVDGLVRRMFRIRVRLKERLKAFEDSGAWNAEQTKEAVDAFRRANLYLRYAEDYAIEWKNKQSPLRNSSEFFKGEGLLTLRNPDLLNRFGRLELKAGDIILVRGASFFSATIARIGDVPTNMSHIAMIAERPDGTLHVVEALLEKGLVTYKLEDYLKFEPLPRAAVYRYEDRAIAKKAARELWRIYESNLIKPIPFDILMDADDHSKVACAEASAMAYENATEGKVRLPRYRTEFTKSLNTDFAKGVGIVARNTFAPADIDTDSRFQIVAEHRDLTLLAESRRYDVVLSKLFEKFQQGFTYKFDGTAPFEAIAGYTLRKFGFKKDQVPKDANIQMLNSMIRHRNLVDSLMKDLAAAEAKATRETGRPLSYLELESLFESVCGGKCLELRAFDVNSHRLEQIIRETTFEGAVGARCEKLFESGSQ